MTIEPFIIRALAAGLSIALFSGLLGCFVVWRRMAYFGDALAHSALLGVALGLILGTNMTLTTISVCAVFALLLNLLQQRKVFGSDTILGILAHGALAISLVATSVLNVQSFELESYLFGDILSVGASDLFWILFIVVHTLPALLYFWPQLILTSLHEDLARAEGINTNRMHMLLTYATMLLVSSAIHIVGALLITSLLVIPAATARPWAQTPERMAMLSALCACSAVIFGMAASLQWDTPSGASIITASVALLAITLPIAQIRRKMHRG